MRFLHLDFETFSECPIKHGTWAYLGHESARMLMAIWAIEDGPVVLREYDKGTKLCPPELGTLVKDPDTLIVAFNAEFERLVLGLVLGIWLPPEKFRCTMAMAWHMSYVGGLEKVGHQMDLGQDLVKLKEGRRVMLKLTKPRRPSKNDPRTRWTRENAAEDWDSFCEYGSQDVVASRAIFERVYPTWCSAWMEQPLWEMDQRINDEGWPIDGTLVDAAVERTHTERARMMAELTDMTGLRNPNSRDQFMTWCLDHGWGLENMQAPYLEGELPRMYEPVRSAVALKLKHAKRTPDKWTALQHGAYDGRMRASLEFGAAQRTNRWGGRVFQPQNLNSARGFTQADLGGYVSAIQEDQLDLLADPLEALSVTIRQAVTAKPGNTLVIVDSSSIESVLLGYVAREPAINELFAQGKDTYKAFASELYNIPYEQVTKEQRTFSKPPVLGCGYLLGAKGLVKYAAGYGVDMTQDVADKTVRLWRTLHPEVGKLWNTFQHLVDNLSIGAPELGHSWLNEHRPWLTEGNEFLAVPLPTGRAIWYRKPETIYATELAVRFPDLNLGPQRPNTRTTLYMGRVQNNWGPVFTHPGKFVENYIQALARDVLAYFMLRIERELGNMARIVGHVHDEVVLECPSYLADLVLDTVKGIMSSGIPSLPGLILGAEGHIADRYLKG